MLYSSQQFKYKTTVYKLKEEREIRPITFANLVSSVLYEKRYALVFFLSLKRQIIDVCACVASGHTFATL